MLREIGEIHDWQVGHLGATVRETTPKRCLVRLNSHLQIERATGLGGAADEVTELAGCCRRRIGFLLCLSSKLAHCLSNDEVRNQEPHLAGPRHVE